LFRIVTIPPIAIVLRRVRNIGLSEEGLCDHGEHAVRVW
jgi:hypothetical protein